MFWDLNVIESSSDSGGWNPCLWHCSAFRLGCSRENMQKTHAQGNLPWKGSEGGGGGGFGIPEAAPIYHTKGQIIWRACFSQKMLKKGPPGNTVQLHSSLALTVWVNPCASCPFILGPSAMSHNIELKSLISWWVAFISFSSENGAAECASSQICRGGQLPIKTRCHWFVSSMPPCEAINVP